MDWLGIDFFAPENDMATTVDQYGFRLIRLIFVETWEARYQWVSSRLARCWMEYRRQFEVPTVRPASTPKA